MDVVDASFDIIGLWIVYFRYQFWNISIRQEDKINIYKGRKMGLILTIVMAVIEIIVKNLDNSKR